MAEVGILFSLALFIFVSDDDKQLPSDGCDHLMNLHEKFPSISRNFACIIRKTIEL